MPPNPLQRNSHTIHDFNMAADEGNCGIATAKRNGTKIVNGKLNGYKKSSNGVIGEIHSTQQTSPPPRRKAHSKSQESFEEVPLITALLAYFGFYLFMLVGYLNEFVGISKVPKEKNREGYVPLYDEFESFYLKYVYRRMRDCWNRPVCSVPGGEIVLKDRTSPDYGWTFKFTGTTTKCINLGSYNYLGFAENEGPCATAAEHSILKYGVSTCSTRQELGTLPIHIELEEMVAKFMGAEDAITFSMGFATNSLNLPSIVSKGCLVISDERNHASIILGLRLSGATVRVFKHNNVKSLHEKLRDAVVYGQPRTHRPWKKIFIVVEGIYSMEGSICHLPEIIELKKRYKAYLFVDEAHSVGALGKRGRGVADYYGCNPRDVDIMMGTFTKSFAAAGGYIAGSKALIDHLRVTSHAACYGASMAAPVCLQIITSMRTIMGEDGSTNGRERIARLAKNSRYFRQRLNQMGFITYGNDNSPVVPLLLYMHSKIASFLRTLKEHGVATVGAGFPATPLMEGRARFCISASHTKETLDKALEVIDKAGDYLGVKYSQRPRSLEPIIYDVSDDELDEVE